MNESSLVEARYLPSRLRQGRHGEAIAAIGKRPSQAITAASSDAPGGEHISHTGVQVHHSTSARH